MALLNRLMFAFALSGTLLASVGLPARAADPAVVTCFVNLYDVVALPGPNVYALRVDSWNSQPLNARVILYTAAKSYTLDLQDVRFNPTGEGAKDGAPMRTGPVFFRLPTAAPIETATLDFRAEGSGCLTEAGFSGGRTTAAKVAALTEAFDRDKPTILDGVLRGAEAPLSCPTPYRQARDYGLTHLSYDTSVPPENGFVVVLVGLTRDGGVSSIGLLDSNVTRPFEGAALKVVRGDRYDSEIFRCAKVASGLLYRFEFTHDK